MNHLNLMPVHRQRRQLRRRRLKQWAALVLVSIGSLAALSWWEKRENARLQDRVDALARQYQPIKVMQDEIDAIRKQIETLKTQQKMAAELAKQKSVVSLMGLLSDAAAQRPDRICVRKLVLTTKRIDSEAGAQFERDLTLEGLALSSGDISVFSSSLENSKAFATVHLESSATREFGDVEAQSYALHCSY